MAQYGKLRQEHIDALKRLTAAAALEKTVQELRTENGSLKTVCTSVTCASLTASFVSNTLRYSFHDGNATSLMIIVVE